MRNVRQLLVVLGAGLLLMGGGSGAHAAPGPVPTAVTVNVAAPDEVAAAALQMGPWEYDIVTYSSSANCRAAGERQWAAYAGYWIGGRADWKCSPYLSATCPPVTRWHLMFKDWYDPNGPLVAPAAAVPDRPVLVAAC